MYQQKMFSRDFPRFAFVQGSIKDVTVVTPVTTEDQQDALFVPGRQLQCFIDLFFRVCVSGIEIRLDRNWIEDFVSSLPGSF